MLTKMVGRPKGGKNNSGGIAAPRKSNGNIDWDKIRSKYLRPILNSQIAPNTSRGLMYILKSKDILKKSDYNGLTNHLTDWRISGEIGWDEIADGSGRGVFNDFSDYETPIDFITNQVEFLRYAGENYRNYLKTQWRWRNQPHYVEFWNEKHAVVSTVAALVGDWWVKVAYNKGDPGWGYMCSNYQRLLSELRGPNAGPNIGKRKLHVFYLGDYDKYGRDMDRQIRVQLEHFGIWKYVHFERIGIIPEQIAEYGLIPNDDNDGYEIDALNAFNPHKFKKLLYDHIEPYFDEDIYQKLLAEHPAADIDKLVRNKVKLLSRKGERYV